jgi:N-acetylneuraminic acid mutarotase
MRWRFVTALIVCLCVTPVLAGAVAGPSSGPATVRTLSFVDRVRMQDAIERLSYGHQIGATKPFAEAVPRAVIEAKVRLYLEESAALEVYWKNPITDEALQAEIERMARGTRMPERLQEIYAVLGNDAFLIKECVARATLADRLTHNFHAFDPRYHAASRAAIDSLREQLASGELSPKAEHPNRTVSTLAVGSEGEAPADPSIDRRVPQAEFDERRGQLAAAGQASPVVETRDAFSFDVVLSESLTSVRVATYVVPKVAWTAWWSAARTALTAESVVAVALDGMRIPRPAKGVAFDPNTACMGDGWSNGILDDLPEARSQHSAVWTGSVMLIWGGAKAGFSYLDTGGRYDPVTDTWQTMTTANAPRGRVGQTAVWTGSEMIVWGGYDQWSGTWFVSGGRYDPIADRWTRVSLGPSARQGHTAVWTGSRMIVWGGTFIFASDNYVDYLNTGALYDPSTDSWTPTSTAGAPLGRDGHTAIWTGSRMIVWGGNVIWNGGSPTGDGGRYDPATDSWSSVSYADGRRYHSVVWTGSSMVVWGGEQLVSCPSCPGGRRLVLANTGARYDPVLDRWIGLSDAGAPPPMESPLVVWTGHDMLLLAPEGPAIAGWRYDPSTDHWSRIASDGSSLSRQGASFLWTGNLAIVWGGVMRQPPFLFSDVNTGERYDPWSDSWTPTSSSSPPSQRFGHSAVWTGNEMIVWGGTYSFPQSGYVDGGDRYDPATDSWTDTSTESAPLPRSGHTALWTGSEMIVWGGGYSNSGGRYDPRSDSWRAISEADAPAPRIDHAAAWTGRQMVVWGGLGDTLQPLQSGGVYDPATEHWTATATDNAPSARQGTTAVWTGDRIAIWGGYSGSASSGSMNTGGLYDPETATWTPTSLTGAPSARPYHTAVWAGGRMIVWGGGYPGRVNFDTGGRYDPATDTWSPTTTVGAPPARTLHAAVAAGNLMLTWGGYPNGNVNTGGIYDVVNDRWTKIMKPGESTPTRVTAVWSGEAMIVWSGSSGGRYYLGHSLDDDCDHDGVSAAAGDCDDHDPATYPGAPARCDGVGNDCGNVSWPVAFNETDLDRDGWLTCAGDCNDNNLYLHPGQAEACDGWDTDCDGQDPMLTEADNDRDGYRICDGDCDDTRWWISPGDYEQCNGYDDDCDGAIDEGGDALCVANRGCMKASCGGSEGCTEFTGVDGPCDDGNQCTADDRCVDGDCRGTTLHDTPCDDGHACSTDDRCVFGYCQGGPWRDCGDDGNDCNGREICDYVTDACAALDVLQGCDDGNICTFDSCDPAIGCHHVNNVDPCDDGNACTAGDVCGDGLCLEGAAITCDDGNPCTDDACIPSAGCVHTNSAASCDDGSACTGWQACEGGACVGHDPVICAAGDQCHDAGACDPATGRCALAAKPDGALCDDASLCTTGDTCQSGTCTPASSGLSHPNPKSSGYYKKLCEKRAHGQLPYQGDRLADADAVCVGQLTSTFAAISTVDDICDVIYLDQHGTLNHGGAGAGPDGEVCDKGEDELIATALNVCRARICAAQALDSRCKDNTDTTVAESFADADVILSDAARDHDTCKSALCELREINNGHALEMNSLLLAREGQRMLLSWASAVLDDGSGAPSAYDVWRRPMASNDAFAKIGTTAGLTFVDASAGAAAWEYTITAIIPGD